MIPITMTWIHKITGFYLLGSIIYPIIAISIAAIEIHTVNKNVEDKLSINIDHYIICTLMAMWPVFAIKNIYNAIYNIMTILDISYHKFIAKIAKHRLDKVIDAMVDDGLEDIETLYYMMCDLSDEELDTFIKNFENDIDYCNPKHLEFLYTITDFYNDIKEQ